MTAPRKRREANRPVRAIGYVRVSTDRQAESGAGLYDQRERVTDHAARKGWTVCLTGDEGLSGASVAKRPALVEALATLDAGEADALVVKDLTRLSRSNKDFAELLDRAQRYGWALVVTDMELDTSTAAGEMMATTIMAVGHMERRQIGERTRAGLAAKRAQGVRLGRPSSIPAAVVERIVREQAAGASLATIAGGLTTDEVPTARGGAAWSRASVQSVLRGQDAAMVRARLDNA